MMTLDLYQMDFFPQKTSWSERKKHMGARLPKIITKLSWRECCSRTERQWALPFWWSQWLARIRHCVPAPMEKGHFSGIICRRCLQGTWSTYSGEHNASVFRLCHCSQVPECILQCTKTGVTGTVTNGDKLLCNRCPLKHEARERERGEMLYENMSNWRPAVGKPAQKDTTDISSTWYIYMVWTQPSETEYAITRI